MGKIANILVVIVQSDRNSSAAMNEFNILVVLPYLYRSTLWVGSIGTTTVVEILGLGFFKQ